MPTNYNRANLITESATLFPNNNSQLISPADLRSWLADGTASFVTQKDKSTLENAIFENQGSTLASGATVDLNTATGNYLHISGTGTINSFGTCPAGSRFILMFEAAATLTYNATSLIIPGEANKTTAAGDCCMIVSEGSGNWRIVGYFAISGGGGGGSVTGVTATTPLASSGGTAPDISITQADAITDGYLSSTDWNTFNNKGSGTITALTGDVTASGSGSVAATIANGAVDIPMLSATGTPSATTFLRGDNTWGTPAGASPTGYYAMYQSLVTQSALVNNTGYPMEFEVMDLTNQVTVVNNGLGDPTRITFANAGIYNLQFSSQFQNADNQLHDVTIWIRLNGTDVPGSAGFVSIPNSHGGTPGHLITGWNYLLDVAAGQYYEIVWSTNSAANVTMQFYAAGSPPPSTASTIFTVTQQAGIMAGTGITGMVGTTGPTQTGATQTLSSSDMTITSAANAHTFAIPSAGIATKGLVDLTAQTFTGIKTFGNGTSAGEIRILEPSGDGTNSVGIKAQAMSPSYDLTLPVNAGTSGQVLQTNGSGSLSWTRNGGSINSSYILDTTETGVTGTFAETINKTLLIPANTFSSQTAFKILVRIRKNNEAFNVCNTRIYIGTNPAVIGTFTLGSWNFVAANTLNGTLMQRSVLIINATTLTSYVIPYLNAQSDIVGINGTMASSAIDWTINQYIIVTTQNGSTNASYTNFIRSIQIIPE
jgi:hypothetical protein